MLVEHARSPKSRTLQGRPSHAKPELLRFFDPRFGVAQTGNFCKHVYAILQGLRPSEASRALSHGVLKPFEAFRGILRPPEASLMGFRGLSRPREASTKSQNPFSLQDYEASGTRAYNTTKRGPRKASSPDEPWLPFFIHVKRILSRSWLQVLFILTLFKTSRRTSKGPRPLKMILQKLFLLPQVLISDFSTGLK